MEPSHPLTATEQKGANACLKWWMNTMKWQVKGDSMNLTLMLYLFLTFLPVTLVKIELQKRALHPMSN